MNTSSKQNMNRSIVWPISVMATLMNLSASTKADTAADLSLEQIVVTSQKREELNRNVPLSVSVLNEDQSNDLFSSGQDVRALSKQAPGLYIESSNGRIAPRFYLRGLGNVDFDLAASQPVSFIYDDVVKENVILKSFPLFDIESVEVSRGPQGTLFGRNTTAGVVKVSTKRPTAEPEAEIKLSYGTFNSVNLEGAIGGTLIEGSLFGRLSLLSQKRDDWIDNSYLGIKNAFGGHDETAGRAQILFVPTDNFSALLNYHARSLDGSQTAFQANVFTTGSNKLNSNYHRDTVFYDGGNNNSQEYEGSGGSITLKYAFDSVELTTISAVEHSDGSNTGDIDGGVAGIGPGFIPYTSETIDAGDVDQVTHEVRLASTENNFWSWQMGAFYFESDLSVFTDTGFNAANVFHSNLSTALFAHNTFQFDHGLIIGAGVRVTRDEKDFHSIGVNSLHVEATKTNWDLSATWLYTNNLSFYARAATGFRAPSIQGRNVAFLDEPSLAYSEEAFSFEIGIKGDFFEERLRINGAIFDYTISDFQLSAIGGSSNSNQLMNADKGTGRGFEVDIAILPSPNARISLGYSYAETKIQDEDLLTAVCGSGQCTVTDPVNNEGFANINNNPFPGAPKNIANLSIYYQIPLSSGHIYMIGDWAYSDTNNLALYESREFVVGHQYELNARIGFKNREDDLDISIFARNLTDQHNVEGFVDFNNNTAFVNEPRFLGIEIKKTL